MRPGAVRSHSMDIVYKPFNQGIQKDTPAVVLREDWQTICLKYGSRYTQAWTLFTSGELYKIYTVPANKVFVLVWANCGMPNDTSGPQEGRLFVAVSGVNISIAECITGVGWTQVNSTFNPVIPLILQPTEAIYAQNGSDISNNLFTNFYGYEIDKDLFYKLL